MKIKKAWLITTDEKITRLPDIENKNMDFKTMYPLIECSTIELVALKKGVDMWADENGLMTSMPTVNRIASELYREAYNNQSLMIVGNVIVTDNTKQGDFINQ